MNLNVNGNQFQNNFDGTFVCEQILKKDPTWKAKKGEIPYLIFLNSQKNIFLSNIAGDVLNKYN